MNSPFYWVQLPTGGTELRNSAGVVAQRVAADGTVTYPAGTSDLTLDGAGITATAAELNLIDGAVAGTSVASKALALGANKDTDILALPEGGLKVGAGAGLPTNLVRYVDVTISSAELLALNATPKQLVAAPGANLALVFEGAVAFYDYGTAAYAGIAAGEDLSVKYTDGSGAAVGGCETTGFLDGTADATRYILPTAAASGVSQITPVANAALVAHLLSGEITTGDSPIKMRVYYRVVPTVL